MMQLIALTMTGSPQSQQAVSLLAFLCNCIQCELWAFKPEDMVSQETSCIVQFHCKPTLNASHLHGERGGRGWVRRAKREDVQGTGSDEVLPGPWTMNQTHEAVQLVGQRKVLCR